MSSSSACSGITDWLKRMASSARPRFQVVISANMARPMTMGNQPPSKNLSALAAKNGMSKARKSTSSGRARLSFQPQFLISTTK